MNSAKSTTLRVPGARLFYQVSGSGPLLLMIAGGGGGSAGFHGIANALADSYTCVLYNRRGTFRSPLDDPDEDVSLEMHSDDAHRLLAELSSEPAYVFGSSGGALIGLDLVAHHPDQVRMLVAHEPPAEYLLPDGERLQGDLMGMYRREGGLATLRLFLAQNGISYEDREPGVELTATREESAANADAFFRYTLPAVRRYRLDFAALLAAATRIVVAGGSVGREYVGYRGAMAVAERLGTAVVEFPGHHVGYMTQPGVFADRLRDVFGGDSDGAV
jgi:pimeloyl-ACP methyl ester carboxylesterase